MPRNASSENGVVNEVRARAWRPVAGGVVFLLGCAALAMPFLSNKIAPFMLGLLIVVVGLLQVSQAFGVRDPSAGNSGFFGGAMSVVIGLLLIALPKLTFSACALLIGLSFVAHGLVEIVAVVRGTAKSESFWALTDGAINVLLGLAIAGQWPLRGTTTIGTYVGIRALSAGWSMLLGRDIGQAVSEEETASRHPDRQLRLEPHQELAKLRATLAAEDGAMRRLNRYWRVTFILTFFAIHVGRMDADWNLVGLLSPGVAVVGDLVFALLLAYGLVMPLHLGWRALTRPVERRAWGRWLARSDRGAGPGLFSIPIRWWLTGRFRYALRLSIARTSPSAAIGQGLQVGLPLAAILIALNPIWGFSWYFNTENWATEAWAKWAEHRTDSWREQMVRAVQAEYGAGESDAGVIAIAPDGVTGGDFSFLVIGDPGEGDASQHVLCDQFLQLGHRPEVKFLVVLSDVIYPAGAMKDYETNFYLPFKGFSKPIYAIPGNHDWYDALEGFAANFLEAPAARAAIRARAVADLRLTTTTENKIEDLIAEAARLRTEYGVRSGGQRAPYFEVMTDRFALIAVDTGIKRSVDDGQKTWLLAALDRARGKFKFVVLGHPFYAAGQYQADGDAQFSSIHRILRDHEVNVVMAGDTHYFEYYRETEPAGGPKRPTHHFVNGGGGAYLSIGTPLAWPAQPAVADCAIYPRADAVTAKLDAQTPTWKRPLWFWVKKLGAWPSSPEAMASAFDFNRAPFFQSFVEVRVEPSTGVVRIWPHGVKGRLRWRDLQVYGKVTPTVEEVDAPVEFRIPLRSAAP